MHAQYRIVALTGCLMAATISACSPAVSKGSGGSQVDATTAAPISAAKCSDVFGTWFSRSAELERSEVFPQGTSYVIDFGLQDGKKTYRSWLHERLSDNGTYTQDGCLLSVTVDGSTETLRIKNQSGNQLWLQSENADEPEKFYHRGE